LAIGLCFKINLFKIYESLKKLTCQLSFDTPLRGTQDERIGEKLG